MAEGEPILVLWLVGLIGGIVGAGVMSLVWAYCRRRASDSATRREVIATWLAARISLGRASVSFVAAFRALGVQAKDSPYAALRHAEAQRARSHWVLTVQNVDIAEAGMRVWFVDRWVNERMEKLGRVSVQSLRHAIDGRESDVDHLMHNVLEMDRDAMALSEDLAARLGHSRRIIATRQFFRRLVAQLEAITDGWSRRES